MQAMWEACKELKDLNCFRFHGDPKDWYGLLKAIEREIREVLRRQQVVRTRLQCCIVPSRASSAISNSDFVT